MPSGSEVAAAAARNATIAMESVAERPDNNMSPRAVEEASPQIQTAVERAINATPEMQHVLNTEPWYTKRSRWSAIISIAFVVLGPFISRAGLPVDTATANFISDLMTALGGAWAAYLAYRAGTAKVPLGSSPTPMRYPQNRG